MSNVVNMFPVKEEKKTEEGDTTVFEDVVARNLKNQERLRLERVKANKGVIRTHGLK